jgi:H+/Cl- antiporter ClcA
MINMRFYRLAIATILVGIGSGISGMCLSMLLHTIQHIAYGYSLHVIIGKEHFLQGVQAAAPMRRLLMLFFSGCVAGFGWWALYRYGKPLVSIAAAIKTMKKMPPLSTFIHALLQITTIGLGSPLGREVAPREMASVCATWIAQKMHLTLEESRMLLACGAGAGLAAGYNMPLGGAFFTLEVLLQKYQKSAILPAFITSAISVMVSWIGLGDHPLYHQDALRASTSLWIWAILTGPVFGVAAYGFHYITAQARATVKRDWSVIPFCLLTFIFIGCCAMYFPALLGNGESPAQLTFENNASIVLAAELLFLRVLIVWLSLRSGAQGGLLTPSLANGALLAVILGGFWCWLWPAGTNLSSFSLVGAAAFLGASQGMPVTAVVLIFEITRLHISFFGPVVCAVAGSAIMCRWCTNKLK